MKNLFLLRHAHADNNSLNDFDRILTQEGIDKCQVVGKILKDYDIDVIYSSDAARTKQTIENILPYLKTIPRIKYIHELYKATAAQLLEFIDALNDYENVLLVNHNPAISDLGLLLTSPAIDSDFYLEIQQGFSPASLALFTDKQLTSFWR